MVRPSFTGVHDAWITAMSFTRCHCPQVSRCPITAILPYLRVGLLVTLCLLSPPSIESIVIQVACSFQEWSQRFLRLALLL